MVHCGACQAAGHALRPISSSLVKADTAKLAELSPQGTAFSE